MEKVENINEGLQEDDSVEESDNEEFEQVKEEFHESGFKNLSPVSN